MVMNANRYKQRKHRTDTRQISVTNARTEKRFGQKAERCALIERQTENRSINQSNQFISTLMFFSMELEYLLIAR